MDAESSSGAEYARITRHTPYKSPDFSGLYAAVGRAVQATQNGSQISPLTGEMAEAVREQVSKIPLAMQDIAFNLPRVSAQAKEPRVKTIPSLAPKRTEAIIECVDELSRLRADIPRSFPTVVSSQIQSLIYAAHDNRDRQGFSSDVTPYVDRLLEMLHFYAMPKWRQRQDRAARPELLLYRRFTRAEK